MRSWLERLKSHKATAAMTIFLVAFYGFLFYSNLLLDRPQTGEPRMASEHLSLQEIQAREKIFNANLDARPQLRQAIALTLGLLLLAGLFLNGYLLFKKWADGKPWIARKLEAPSASWSLGHLYQALVVLFFSEAALLSVEAILAGFLGEKNLNHDTLLVLNSLARDLIILAWIFYLVQNKLKSPLSNLGLRGESWGRHIGVGLLGYLAVLPVLMLCLFAIASALQFFSYEPSPQQVVQIYLKKGADPYLMYLTLFVALLGPIIEEIFFRGFFYPALRRKIGVLGAMAAVSALFAAFHMNAILFVPIFLLGMFLVYLYERTGSLVGPITAHVFHNLIMVGLTLGFKNLSH